MSQVRTMPQVFDAWRRSQYGGVALRNYLAFEYGGAELGRPTDVQAALAESFGIIEQRLGSDPAWTPPGNADGTADPVSAA